MITEYRQAETHVQTCTYIRKHCALFSSLQSLVGVQGCQAEHQAPKHDHLLVFSFLSVLLTASLAPQPSSAPPSSIKSSVVQRHSRFGPFFVKAESHRSTEQEVERGRGSLFLQIQAVFRVSGFGRDGKRSEQLAEINAGAAPGYPRS